MAIADRFLIGIILLQEKSCPFFGAESGEFCCNSQVPLPVSHMSCIDQDWKKKKGTHDIIPRKHEIAFFQRLFSKSSNLSVGLVQFIAHRLDFFSVFYKK